MNNLIKILLICLLGVHYSALTFAQNLVPNPSFEDTVQCPHGNGILDAKGWLNCGFSPDYYNACANSTFPPAGVPNGLYSGYQYAFDGDAFAGIVTYQDQQVLHEFISTQLLQPLVIGTKYFVSAYICSGVYVCSANNFGFKFFTTMPFDDLNLPPIDNFAHVYSDSLISDSVNWIQIAGSFTADSAYQYITIGNFFDNVNTDTMYCSPPGDGAYYLVDGVCVSSDSTTCYDWTSISIDAIERNQTTVYPNPASYALNVKNLSSKASFSMHNLLGATVKRGTLADTDDKIRVDNLPNGIYFLILNKQTSYKIIINR